VINLAMSPTAHIGNKPRRRCGNTPPYAWKTRNAISRGRPPETAGRPQEGKSKKTRARMGGRRTAVARGVAGVSADVQQTLGLDE
jgi:hypothetical protein